MAITEQIFSFSSNAIYSTKEQVNGNGNIVRENASPVISGGGVCLFVFFALPKTKRWHTDLDRNSDNLQRCTFCLS